MTIAGDRTAALGRAFLRGGVAPAVTDSVHRLPDGYRVATTAILGGLHHEYRLVTKAA